MRINLRKKSLNTKRFYLLR